MKYSVLVKTVVNVRVDNIEAESPEAAITLASGCVPIDSFSRDFRIPVGARNPDGTTPSLRYTEWAEEDHEYLVDEADDHQFQNSKWYAADGITQLLC